MRLPHPDSRDEGGFALVGVMILVAVMAIFAVAAGALYLRQLDQQRQLVTQKSLEAAFHGLFPGHQRPTANMWKDFRFTPDIPATPTGGYDLSCMVSRASVGVVDVGHAGVIAYSGTPNPLAGGSLGAWNGPYWQGSLDAQNRPADAWGRPMRLRYVSTSTPPGWQLISAGINGALETGNSATPSNDDQVYPQPPYVLPAGGTIVDLPSGYLLVNWVNIHSAEQIRVLVENLVNGAWVIVLQEDNFAINKNTDYVAPPAQVQAGQVRITVWRKPGGAWTLVTGFPKLYTVPPAISEEVNIS